jgi:hypothetical protein
LDDLFREPVRTAWFSYAHANYWTFSFLDCDMLMRYLWGLAVGHLYTHESLSGTSSTSKAGGRRDEASLQRTHANNGSDCEVDSESDIEEPDVIASGSKEMDDGYSQDGQTDDALELTLEDHDSEYEDWYLNPELEDDNPESGGDSDVASDFED